VNYWGAVGANLFALLLLPVWAVYGAVDLWHRL
jgi:hypothetical protein